jgi:hypothetical protein
LACSAVNPAPITGRKKMAMGNEPIAIGAADLMRLTCYRW